jgi:outer membrane protein
MKNVLRKLIPGLLLISFLGGSAFGQGRLATVDLRKVFDGYWKKKQAEAALKDRQADMEKEDKNMLDDYKKMKDEYQTLLTGANDQAVAADERDKRKKAAEDKLKEIKQMEETITQYERQARSTIQDQSQRMRSNIITEIRNVVSGKAKSAGYTLVIDTASESNAGTPIVLFTSNENDITDEVLAQLNAAAPTDTPKTDEPAPGKKDEKKKDSKK